MLDSSLTGGGWPVYRRLLGYAFVHWRYMLIAIAGMVVFSATNAGFASLMKPMLDGSFVARDPGTIRWVPIVMVAILLVRGIGGYLSSYYISYVGRCVIKRLRTEMFAQLLYAPVAYFDYHSSGQLISKLTYNVEQVADAATKGITILVRDSTTILFLLALMFYQNWQLTAVFLLVAPLIAAIVSYASRRFRRISHNIQDSMGEVTHVVEEMISGQREVKIFGGQAYEAEQFEQVNERNRRLRMKLVATRAASTPLIQVIVGLALAGIVFIATLPAMLDEITVGTFVSFIIAMTMLLTPARKLTIVNETLQQGIAAGQSVFELLDIDQESRVAGKPARVRGDIIFDNIGFSYQTGNSGVLRAVSFRAAAGETVAFVGRSGSGKSTLVHLLARFYEPNTGAIWLDGVNIGTYDLMALRSQIAYVGQDVVLFNDTIRNNIAYGYMRNAGEAALLQAARAAHADEFIEPLPAGLDTQVGENGVLLSGGQRQRLAIARALLKDAPILILDEATSALDNESEAHIKTALDTLCRNRTTLVVAHRLSTVERADRIVVLEQGRVVETGAHNDLIAAGGLYAKLYRSQLDMPDDVHEAAVVPG